jgi:hypothetical protein
LAVVGVHTRDFALYHDIVNALKHRQVPFLSLVEEQEVPARVDVILSTPGHAPAFPGAPVIFYDPAAEPDADGNEPAAHADVEAAIDAALRHQEGRVEFNAIVVGVDPGERPGVAVLGDGQVLTTFRASSPEEVAPSVKRRLADLATETVTVRVGHGDATNRDRVINAVLEAGLAVEQVDETQTSPPSYKPNRERDVTAAKRIGLAEGEPVLEPREVRPTRGELGDIQRRSRKASDGDVTIPEDLARKVATGAITLEEAIREQRGRVADA